MLVDYCLEIVHFDRRMPLNLDLGPLHIQRVVDAAGYGVPTICFPDGQCLLGPVLIDSPAGEAAVRPWHAVAAWTELPHL